MPRRVFRVDQKLFQSDEYLRALNSNDHMGIVLRTHAYVEAFLLDLIESQLPTPGVMDWTRLGFEEKLNLAVALDLIDTSEKPGYLKLNAWRNNLAHHPSATVRWARCLS